MRTGAKERIEQLDKPYKDVVFTDAQDQAIQKLMLSTAERYGGVVADFFLVAWQAGEEITSIGKTLGTSVLPVIGNLHTLLHAVDFMVWDHFRQLGWTRDETNARFTEFCDAMDKLVALRDAPTTQES